MTKFTMPDKVVFSVQHNSGAKTTLHVSPNSLGIGDKAFLVTELPSANYAAYQTEADTRHLFAEILREIADHLETFNRAGLRLK